MLGQVCDIVEESSCSLVFYPGWPRTESFDIFNSWCLQHGVCLSVALAVSSDPKPELVVGRMLVLVGETETFQSPSKDSYQAFVNS